MRISAPLVLISCDYFNKRNYTTFILVFLSKKSQKDIIPVCFFAGKISIPTKILISYNFQRFGCSRRISRERISAKTRLTPAIFPASVWLIEPYPSICLPFLPKSSTIWGLLQSRLLLMKLNTRYFDIVIMLLVMKSTLLEGCYTYNLDAIGEKVSDNWGRLLTIKILDHFLMFLF